MATTNFVSGTLIESTWLNDADAHVYDQATAAHTAANIAVVDTAGNFTATDVEGVLAELSTGSGLQYFIEDRSIAAPNATVPVHSFTALGSETNIDVVLAPKGTGAILADIPDGTATGGNKRGVQAVDFQLRRTSSSRVAGGANSCILGGEENETSASFTSILGGSWGTCDGDYSSVLGGFGTYLNGLSGKMAYNCGSFVGGVQSGIQMLTVQTTDATVTPLTVNAGAAAASTVPVLLDNSVWLIKASVVGRTTTSGSDVAAWTIEALVRRDSGVATIAIVGTPTITKVAGTAGTVSWDATITVNTTLGSININATGAAATTIRWICKVDSTELL